MLKIKEILDYLKRSDKNKFGFEQGKLIDYEEVQTLLDYITNLQQENEKLKYNARGQVNDYFKDKYADEVLKNAELQQDLDKANDIIEKDRQFYKCRMDEYAELKKENERLNNKTKEQNLLLIEFQDMEQKVDIYKSRCEKAVEYIKMYKCDYSPYELTDSAIRNVLNILIGSDENE